MTRYEYRVLARTIYGAAIMACDFMAALTMAASETDVNKARGWLDRADDARRLLVAEYRANGGEIEESAQQE